MLTKTIDKLKKNFFTNRRKYYLILFLYFAFLIIITYSNALKNGFVSDDIGISLQDFPFSNNFFYIFNPEKALTYLSAFVRLITMFIQYHFCGLWPSCFRLANILLHLGNTIFFYFLVSLLFKRRVGFFSATLFAIHPLLSEPIVWISAGNYLEYTFLILLSLIFYILSRDIHKKTKLLIWFQPYFYTAALFLFFCATFTTNRIWAFPLFLVYEISFGNLRQSWKRLLPFASVAFTYLGLQLFAIQAVSQDLKQISGNDSNFINPLIQIPLAVGTLIRLFLWPEQLSFAHVFSYSSFRWFLTDIFINSALCLILLVTMAISFFKSKKIFFGLAFFTSSLALYLTPLTVASLVAERYVYLASIGLFICLGYLIDQLYTRSKFKIIVIFLFSIYISLLTFRTFQRNKDWYSDATLLESTLKVNPNIPKIKYELGILYFNSNDLDKALNKFTDYTNSNPTSFNANSYLGLIYKQKKDYSNAALHFLIALEKNPNSIETLQNLAELNYEYNDFDKALLYTQKELALSPSNSNLYLNLGKLYLKKGDKTQAKYNLQKSINLNPTNIAAKKYLEDLTP